MLCEIMSDEFVSKGSKRGRITFHSGLNTVRGGKQSDNSIGKSTFLLAVDFCFGGDTYYTGTDVKARFADVRHTVNFAFVFGEKKEYYSRSIVTPTEVNKCNENYNVIETIKLADFRQHLFEMYRIDLPSITFRDIVGRYMRVYGKDNYSEKLPLQADTKESASASITALEKLFNYYTQIEQYKLESKKKEDKKKAFNDAKKEDVLQIYVPTARQAKDNDKEIERLEQELQALTDTIDVNMTEEDMDNADAVLAIKSRITLLKRNRSKLISQQNTIKINNSSFIITDSDYRELSEFFPGIDIQRLATVEKFHQQIHSILEDEMEEEIDRLQALISVLDAEIEDLHSQQRKLGIPVTLPQKFLQKHTDLTRKIAVLKSQNKARETSQTLVADVVEAKKALADVEMEVLNLIASKINEQMVRFNDYIYNGTRMAPVIRFESSAKYSFYTPDDGGMGTGFKSMIVFDLSILKLTPLPAIIHDSLMFNHIGYEPLERIMELYLQSGKQIFIAYDKQDAPTKRIQEVLDATTVIHLNEGGNELYGYSWAKKTNNVTEQ
ncbi:MAG: hypothetical protein KGZ56_11295 [Dethiobacter sp.]|nr:hypothetical protein [Dethiobacter sp.]